VLLLRSLSSSPEVGGGRDKTKPNMSKILSYGFAATTQVSKEIERFSMQHQNTEKGDERWRPYSFIWTYCIVLPVVLMTLWLITAMVLEAWRADRTRGQAGVPAPLAPEDYLRREEELGITSISFAPLRTAARWLFYCQPELSLEVASVDGGAHSSGDERFASWFLTPSTQLLGYFTYSIVFVTSIVGGLMRGKWVLRVPARDNTAKMNRIELLNAVVTSLLAFGVIAYKTATAALARREGSTSADVLANWFLLQPCHVFCIGLGVIYWSRRWKVSIYFFNVYLHLMWGVALALVFAEMEEYNKRGYPLETFHFYLEHWVLVLAPFILIAMRTSTIRLIPQEALYGTLLRSLYRYVFCWLLTYLFSRCIIPAWVAFCERYIWSRSKGTEHSGHLPNKAASPVEGGKKKVS
ncbi:hypothetical protein Pmar_PMAR026103, partial [Perkinsus marinus ATCC 50983]